MSKAIWYEKQTLIVLLWSVLIFIGYNVITVEAAESDDDKKVCESYGGEWTKSDVGEDRYCKIDNEKDQQLYSIRPGFSLDSTGADAEYGREDLGMTDEEAAAQEDAICDDEDAETTNISLCKSDKKDDDEGKRYVNPDGGAPLYEDELTEDEKDDYTEYKPEKENIEDWRNEVEPISDNKIASPITVIKEVNDDVDLEEPGEIDEEADESNDVEEAEEESDDDESEDDEQEEDEPEENNSDSESEQNED